MRILLTNDDGIDAPGIRALGKALAKIGEVVVAAPSSERSAASQSITVHHPILVKSCSFEETGGMAWRIDGTPADCVKLALEELLDEMPDAVVSGINLGANLGTDVLYSGTVAAAIEGAMHNLPSLAISLDVRKEGDFTAAAAFAAKFLPFYMEKRLPPRTLLNINIPQNLDAACEEPAITELGIREYANAFEKRRDPRGRTYYWIGGKIVDGEHAEQTDIYAVKHGRISITPIHFDLTNYGLMDEIRRWETRL